jgi:hypothetical protein
MYRRIRPGISGLWQISCRNDTGYGERVKLEVYYVKTWSVWLDLVILVRSVRSVIFGRRTYSGCSSECCMQVELEALYLGLLGSRRETLVAQLIASWYHYLGGLFLRSEEPSQKRVNRKRR